MILDLYKAKESKVVIEQLPLKRDWMDNTYDRHAYHCFPMTLANRLGWGISLVEDISFIWDGEISTDAKHIKILKGEDFCTTGRANRTLSINTNIILSPQKNISILTTSPPNYFFDEFECVSTIISTSALVGDFPIAIIAKKPNEIITIKAGTPIATLIPLNLTELNNMELIVKNNYPDFMYSKEWRDSIDTRSIISKKMNSKGRWTHFYRDAVDHNGNKLGEHESKKIIMRIYNEK